MGKKYIKLKSGDSFELEKSGSVINMCCCDCGLVHNIIVTTQKKNKIKLMLFRDNRRTGQKRRHNNFSMKLNKGE